MKYFIKRRNKLKRKAAFGSALLMVSAFAMFTSPLMHGAEKKENKAVEVTDSAFNARYVFENIHTSALEILPRTTRLDMLDYWDVDSVFKASNALEGLSWIESLSDSFLKVRISSASELQIKILPYKKGKIVMTINTVGDDVQAQDSRINFYDEELKELPTEKFLVLPHIKDFFEIPKGSATSMKEIEGMIPFPTMVFSANAENNNMEGRLTVEKYINEDDWNIAKLFVKPYITLEWIKDKYKFKK